MAGSFQMKPKKENRNHRSSTISEQVVSSAKRCIHKHMREQTDIAVERISRQRR